MVDDQLGGDERIDALRVAAEGLDGVAHGAEIDDGGNAGEVLHEDAGGHVGDFAAGLGLGIPLGEELDVGGGDVDAVFAAQQVFKQDLEAEGKPAEVEAARGERGKADRWYKSGRRRRAWHGWQNCSSGNLSIRTRADANLEIISTSSG